jgi:hypothetical protein
LDTDLYRKCFVVIIFYVQFSAIACEDALRGKTGTGSDSVRGPLFPEKQVRLAVTVEWATWFSDVRVEGVKIPVEVTIHSVARPFVHARLSYVLTALSNPSFSLGSDLETRNGVGKNRTPIT